MVCLVNIYIRCAADFGRSLAHIANVVGVTFAQLGVAPSRNRAPFSSAKYTKLGLNAQWSHFIKTNPLISSQNKNDMILKLAYFYFKKSALNNKRVWKNYDD